MSLSDKHQPAEFFLFRYQIYADSSPVQLQLDKTITPEILYKERNIYLMQALEKIVYHASPQSRYTYTIEEKPSDTQLLLFVQAERTKTVTQNKKDIHLPHQPYGWVAVDMNSSVQTIGITSRGDLRCEHVFKDLERKLQKILSASNLNIQIEAIRKKRAFWEIVDDNQGKIKEVCIIINHPNMPELTEAFDKELTKFTKSAGAKQTSLILQSKKDSTLDIKETNPQLKSLANYADLGGAKYYFKTTESKKRITPDGKQEIITGTPVEDDNKLLIATKEDEHKKSILTRIRELCTLSRR